jgi:Sensors of blue-light using FAD
MKLIRLVYASTPFGFDAGHLDDILTISRTNNARYDVTGSLVCRADLYLQWLEGSEACVEAVFARITADDRHQDIKLFSNEPIAQRLFPAWAMRDDPAKSWMWSQADVAGGAVNRASADDVIAVFTRIAAEAV